SSTWIREEIKKGNIAFANSLMGRPYFFTGQVMYGKQIGKTIGFPTANLIPDPSKLLPPKGVYVSTVEVDGKTYPAVTNVGLNPTVEGAFVTVEAHILDFDENIYDKVITIFLYQFLRPELRFDNLEALKEQIAIDLKRVQDTIN
ncbi:MAG: hypothetical protein H7X94_04670, partial [Vallitaleaceae bacterium]|nr:hypothetical protein [Vallitaleaceae bacterium]